MNTPKDVLYELARKGYAAGLMSDDEIKAMLGYSKNHKPYFRFMKVIKGANKQEPVCL